MGKHSKPGGWFAAWRKRGKKERFPLGKLVKMVDTETLNIHLLKRTFERLPDYSYVALCGKRFFPAGMVEPGLRPCVPCFSHVIPEQRGFRR